MKNQQALVVWVTGVLAYVRLQVKLWAPYFGGIP